MSATVHPWSEPQLELSEMFPRQDEQVHSTVLDGESVLLNLNPAAITRSMSSDLPFGICAEGSSRCGRFTQQSVPALTCLNSRRRTICWS